MPAAMARPPQLARNCSTAAPDCVALAAAEAEALVAPDEAVLLPLALALLLLTVDVFIDEAEALTR